VPQPGLVCLAADLELVPREGTNRLQQRDPRLAVGPVDDPDEADVHEMGHRVQRVVPMLVVESRRRSVRPGPQHRAPRTAA